MFSVTSRGDWGKTTRFLLKASKNDVYANLETYGRMGVQALARATPKDSGLSASSWGYRIIRDRRGPGIEWYNTNVTSTGVPVVILIQYGHGTKNGGYVQGQDFINPVMKPIFEMIVNDIWKKVRL